MGLLDFLFGKVKCPQCGTKGARTSDGRIRCPNPLCQYFDGTLGRVGRLRLGGTRTPRRSDYSPARALYIRYRNFQDQERTFTADKGSLRRKGNHMVARVAPTGENISLSRDRIQNLTEVEDALPEVNEGARTGPTARERQVLAFHKKYKSTSPLYERIRAKYPDW
ncbi:MAG TPA: hypothetical protein VI431_10790 [Candidatus Acidoferrum sp.]